ncbi:unnamed protein product (macronuclear) [Paramecium tetraurelia]|uniref:Uncharacterized protein n=1 Tax=Paramecium tetraurelia TaxID=5888 RepID=A0BCV0_PARTE|nr:uncharacterized protein GSPATT00004461001 [Paramecium tetraurelia]CAK56367.1 unnamed protein product [Paramecium tetraurelia]|eukprot:XP_001423765.1 hypothetical protein (macronuclear) [Paramecium tetraurelia strain d4-2]
MHSFKDLDITDTENEQSLCNQHHNEIIKVCLSPGCDQLKLCQSCLSSHFSSHKEITIYQLFKEVQAKLQKAYRVEKSKDKFDIVFKYIQEMRQQVHHIFNQLEQDIKQYLIEKINIDELNQNYQTLININENNYTQYIPILKLYYLNPNIFYDGQLQLAVVEDTILTKLLILNEKLKLQVDKLKNDAEQLFEIKTRKPSEHQQEDSVQLLTTINGHENVVRSVIKLHNGDYATASRDKTIKIWNQNTFQCIQTLRDHINWVQDLTLIPDNKFASCSDDKTIKIYMQFTQGQSEYRPQSVLWECVNTLRGHESYVVRIVYNDQFNYLITCSTDGTLRLWDPSQKNALTVLQGHENCVYTLATQANLIVSGDEGGQLIKWSLNHMKIEQKEKKHSGCVNSILINARIYSCGDDRKVNVWDTNLQLCYVIQLERAELESLQFINDELIVGGDEQGYLQFINLNQRRVISEIPVHNDRIYKIKYYDGILCTASSDLSVKLFKFNI